MSLPRVVFIGAGCFAPMLARWLQTQPCDVEFASVNDTQPFGWPEFDLGLNFLGTQRVGREQVADGHKFINFHPAPLPEYGGRNLAYHAILDGAAEFGATIHYMSLEFDTGDIIEVSRFPIRPDNTAGDLYYTATNLLVALFQKWVPKLLAGPVPATPQAGQTRYYKKGPINDYLWLSEEQKKVVRALTCHPQHHAKLNIAGKTYRIVPEE